MKKNNFFVFFNGFKIVLMLIFYSICVINFSVAQYTQNVEKIFLTNFLFKEADNDSSKWLQAFVPGTVHSDLFKNKTIAAPFFSDNENYLQWVEQKDWEYKTDFFITDKQFNKYNIQLVFEGLDTYADIYMNDIFLATTDNMFVKWQFDVRKILRRGNNNLRIIFHSPYNFALAYADKYSMKLPAGNDKGAIKTSVFTRKAPYHYGWDWGPRFATCGIWRSAYIQTWDIFKIENYYFKPLFISEKNAQYEIQILLNSSVKGNIDCKIKNNEVEIYKKQFVIDTGVNKLYLPLTIKNPQLWWPNGYGIPYLYPIKIEIQKGNQKEIIQHNVGVRTVKLLQNVDSIGTSFAFEINGRQLFMKGANYIPMDVFLPGVSKTKKDSLLKMAADCGMNMLRVWGGGIYEDDYFYECCDKYGILVWQDFMFACSLYPWDSAFLRNVKAEAIYNVKRLRNYACLALWCGNNEIEEAWYNWGWQKQYNWDSNETKIIWQGYQQLFEFLLPDAVKLYDVVTPYISTSPKFGWGREQSYKSGDSHYWGVWWGMQPFENYKIKFGRFVSEYGFQALPSLFTIKKFAEENDLYFLSSALVAHQKHPSGYQTIDSYLESYYGKPIKFEDYIYVSQLLQAFGIKTAIEAHRSNKPYCMGTLYWQLNDCWPAVSWSGIDYYLQPKALHYQVKRSFKKFLVTSEYVNNILKIAVISDSLDDCAGSLHLQIADFFGNIKWRKTSQILVRANGVEKFDVILPDSLNLSDSTRLILTSVFQIGKSNSFESNHYFCLPKYLQLPEASVNIKSYEIASGIYQIRCFSEVLVKDLFITSETPGIFSDNYFDLLPNKEKVIIFSSQGKEAPVFKMQYLNSILKK